MNVNIRCFSGTTQHKIYVSYRFHQGSKLLMNIPWKNIDYFTIHNPATFARTGAKFIPLFVLGGEPIADLHPRSSLPIDIRTHSNGQFRSLRQSPFSGREKSHIKGWSYLCDFSYSFEMTGSANLKIRLNMNFPDY